MVNQDRDAQPRGPGPDGKEALPLRRPGGGRIGDEFRREARASVLYDGECDTCTRAAFLILTSDGWLCKSCIDRRT